MEFNLGHHSGQLVTKCLSYGMAHILHYTGQLEMSLVFSVVFVFDLYLATTSVV
jgi:hypothetical protein